MIRFARYILLLLVVDFFFAGLSVGAQDGAQLFKTKTCFACHGENGQKAILNYPNLAGQNEEYLFQQLKDIASGKRTASPDATGNPRTAGMKGVMPLVSEDEMRAIAKWLSTLEPAPPIKEDVKNAEKGKKLFTELGCVTCHGPDGKKPIMPIYPIIGGQKRGYLVLQMQDIKKGVRNNGNTAIMAPFMKKATDAQIEALADYMSQIGAE